MRLFHVTVVIISTFLFFGCAKKIADISYIKKPEAVTIAETPKLNVFVPGNSIEKELPVLIFVHGGNWNSGRKGTYDMLGRNFARRGVVTVVPDYTLSPKVNYDGMTKEVAQAIQWTKENIGKYGGDKNQIYVTGHSAGGHLVALAVMNPKYGIDAKTVSGIILNDAAGLDMKNYLELNPPTAKDDYSTTWTVSPEKWKDASPIYFLNKNTPPFLIYVGDKTYPSIKVANANFTRALNTFQPGVAPITLNKKHIPMVLQYFWPWSDRFDEVIQFMKTDVK